MAADELTPPAVDMKLVRAAAAGDDRAFATLFHRHRRSVALQCLGILRDARDAEDAVQETFVRAYRSLARMRAGSFEAWLREVARNVCIDELRRRRRRPAQVPLAVAGEAWRCGGADEEIVCGHADLEASLKRVAAHHRVALELRFVHDLSHREMAHVLGRSPVQVKSLIHRARLSLWREWERAS